MKEFPKIDLNKLNDPIDDPEFDAMVKHEIANAMSKAEYDRMAAESSRLTADYLAGKISSEIYKAAIEKYQFPTIKVETLTEYRYLLTLILEKNTEGIQGIITHENSHMNKLQELGLNAMYGVTIVRDENGLVGVYPKVKAIFPEDMPDDVRRKLTREITEAPDDLSEHDKIHLGIQE